MFPPGRPAYRRQGGGKTSRKTERRTLRIATRKDTEKRVFISVQEMGKRPTEPASRGEGKFKGRTPLIVEGGKSLPFCKRNRYLTESCGRDDALRRKEGRSPLSYERRTLR